MSKYYGKVGFVTRVEDLNEPGVWVDKTEIRNYYGDIIKNHRQWQNQENSTNDNVTINNQISIIADPFAFQNFQYLRWIQWSGAKWKITSVDIEYPRLILSIGGLYDSD